MGTGNEPLDVDVVESATAQSCLVRIDVGVDPLAGRTVCCLLVGHRRDLHTWTGSQGREHREDFR